MKSEEIKAFCEEFNKFKESILGEIPRRVADLEKKVEALQDTINELKRALDLHSHVGEIKFRNPR